MVISPAAAHVVLATAGLHDLLALAAAAGHHFRHESFDFAGGVRAAQHSLALLAPVWACGRGLGAYFAGPAVIDVVDDVGAVTSGILAVVIVGAVVFKIRRRRRRLRQA